MKIPIIVSVYINKILIVIGRHVSGWGESISRVDIHDILNNKKNTEIIIMISLLSIGIAYLILSIWMTFSPLFPVDDAYISFRYVHNWGEGNGLVFNLGERVEGYSNFLWVALLTVCYKIGLTPPLAARIFSLLAILILLVILPRLGTIINRFVPKYVWVGPSLFIAFLPATTFHVLSGLETLFAAVLLTLGVWTFAMRRWLSSAFLFLALALVRPETTPVFGIIFSTEVILAILKTRSCHNLDKRLLLASGVFITLYGIYILWRFMYYSTLLPNTFYAKSGFGLKESLIQAVPYFRSFLFLYFPIIILSSISILYLRNIVVRTIIIIGVIQSSTLLMVGAPDPYPNYRYLYPLLPLIALLATLGIIDLYQRFAVRNINRRVITILLIGMVSILQILTVLQGHSTTLSSNRLISYQLIQNGKNFFNQDTIPHLDYKFKDELGHHYLAQWLLDNAEPTDLIATSEVGIVPYYTNMRVLDTFGLTDRHIALMPGSPGNKTDVDYVFNMQPQFIAFRVQQDCYCSGALGDTRVLNDWRMRKNYNFVCTFQYYNSVILLFSRRVSPTL